MVVDLVVATEDEKIVQRWLLGKKIQFDFRTKLSGGLSKMGESITSFLLPEQRVAIEVTAVLNSTQDMHREYLKQQGCRLKVLLTRKLQVNPEREMRTVLE